MDVVRRHGARTGPRETGFWATTTHNYRVRGYNMQHCVQTGDNCVDANGYRPEPTAQSHALRRLAKLDGRARLPDEINWEVGHGDDPDPDPPCNGKAGFRVDIVKDEPGGFFGFEGPKYRIIEIKNVNRVGEVEGQLACYEQKMRADNLDVGPLADLSDDHWAVYWVQEDTNTRWYAWAPKPGYVLFGRADKDRDRIPKSVRDNAHPTGHERIDLGETLPGFPFELVPEPVPVPLA